MEFVLFYGVFYGCFFGLIVVFEWFGCFYCLCWIEMLLDIGECIYVCLNLVCQMFILFLEDGCVFSESLVIFQYLVVCDLCRKFGYLQGSVEFDELNFVFVFLYIECYLVWGVLFYLEDVDVIMMVRVLVCVV